LLSIEKSAIENDISVLHPQNLAIDILFSRFRDNNILIMPHSDRPQQY
jgi:hypothetical protein